MNISATGSSVLLLNESLVQYEGTTPKLEHGGVTVSTSKLLTTRAGNVVISPVSNVWTEFEERDVDDRVQTEARKGNLTIRDNTGFTTLAEGQKTTRDDSQSQSNKKRSVAPGANYLASGSGIQLPPSQSASPGGVAVGGSFWVVFGHDDPLSPVEPEWP